MNYIKELNAFYERMDHNALSGNAVALWHALMHVNNKARWVETFTAAALTLRCKSGLSDNTFKRARKELVEKGLIEFKSRGGNRAPVYRILSLAEGDYQERVSYDVNMDERNVRPSAGHSTDGEAADDYAESHTEKEDNIHMRSHVNNQGDSSSDQNADHNPTHKMTHTLNHSLNHYSNHILNHKVTPLRKQNKTKQNEKKQDDMTAMDFYQANFGELKPYIAQSLQYWSDESGGALVIEAMKRSLEQDKMSWGYVQGILKTWHRKGVVTVEDAEAEAATFRRERRQNRHSGNISEPASHSTEVVPDWFKERARDSGKNQEADAARIHVDEEKFQALLKEFGAG